MSWPLVELGDLAEFINGFAFKPKDWRESGKKIIRIQNLTNPHKEYNLTELDIPSKYNVTKGDILVSWSATLDVFEWSREDALLNQHIFKVVPDYEKVNKRYFKYALKKAIDSMLKFSRGSTMKHVNRGDFLGTRIPLPPLEEQKRIAAILDKADNVRRKRQQAIQLADDFLRSVFLDMFGDPVTNPKGWEEKILKDIADIRSGVTKGKKVKPEDSITLPYMRVANVQDGYLCLDEVKDITVSNRDAEKCQLRTGDILLTEGGDIDKLGRGYVWNGEIENCIHQNHIFSVRVNSRDVVRPEFLSVLISSQRGKRYFLKVGKQTTGIATINKTVLSEFVPFIPPVESQDKYLKVHDKIKSLFIGWGGNCSLAFNSLSQKAFAGEL